jgi:hypothetical protein
MSLHFRAGVSSEGEEPPEITAVYARVPDGALLAGVRATSGWRP